MNKLHLAATTAPLMQPQPVRSPERCRREESKNKSRRHSYHRPPTAPKKKGNLIITHGAGKNMKTLSYIIAEEEIQIGNKYYFGQLWDGNYDGDELLASGAISPDGENVVAFNILDTDTDILLTLVEVTDIY